MLELAEDKVFDVRLKLCKNLYTIRLKIDEDDDLGLATYKSAI